METIIFLVGLFGMGFGIGLSGALIPGPILAYTIKESVKHGAKTGFLVIIGHFIVELVVIILIIFGILEFFKSNIFSGIIGIAGAVVLFYMAVDLIRTKTFEIKDIKEKAYGPITGGILLTVFNPTFYPWWATVGYNMISEGLKIGALGVCFILAGHWLSDFGWYTVVSTAVAKKKDILLREKVFPVLKVIMSVFMVLLGIYFLINGIKSF